MHTPHIPPHMRALVLDGVGFNHLSVRTIPTPCPGPLQLLARVDAAGICTSLIKLVEQGPDHKLVYGWDVSRFPLILGDEGSVTIVEAGDGLRESYRSGERYVVQPAIDHAPINHRGRYRDNGRGIGRVAAGYTLAGHLAEYMLIPEEVLQAGCLLPLPDPRIPFAHAAVSEPLSCVVSAQDHHVHLIQGGPLSARKAVTGLKPQGVTVVIGAGAMGRMHVDLSFSHRPRAVVVADMVQSRLDLVKRLFGEKAARLGIDLRLVHAGSERVLDVVEQLTGYAGADDVIVAVGSRAAIESAQGLLGRGAVFDLFGGLKKGESLVALDAAIIHYKEVNVTGSSGGSPWDIARVLELIAGGELEPGAHITRIGDLDHAIDFLEMIKAQQIDGKAVVYPHRRTRKIHAVSSWSASDEARYLREEED